MPSMVNFSSNLLHISSFLLKIDRPQTIPPNKPKSFRQVTPPGIHDVAPQMERVGPKCNGKVTVLTAPSGIIQSPNYGIGSYFSDDTCYWQIIAIPGKIIRLQLVVMSLEEGTGCHNDYTTIYDGATESSPLLQAYCGRKNVPSELVTTGSAMFVKFRSDGANQRDGFRFLYSLIDKPSSPTPPPKPPTTPIPKDKCQGRHQIFTSKSGFLISPNFGYGEYYASDVCYWQILAPDNNKVKLSFQTFEVEDGFACPKDELVIYDGPSEMSPLIGSFCGSNKPATIISSSNGLYLKFSTDAHAQYIGFKIFYEFQEPPKKERCNGEMNTLTDTSGFIFSPNYGKGDYPEDDICHWQIIGEENTRVRLRVESLVMEQSPDCTKDYLAIWDGPGENSNKMKVFCGSEAQDILLTTSSYMYLKFKANGDGNYPGFKLYYEVVEAPPKDKCNGKTEVLHDSQGYFQSPNLGNGLYYNNDLCFWDLRAPPGQHIRLIFEKFDLEEANNCQLHDHLGIYDGQSEDAAQIAELCGYELPKTMESSDNTMFLKFQTDAARRAAGFRIFYEFFKPAETQPILPPTPEPCNGKEFLLTGTFGSFNSPNFGNGEYFSDDNCYWLISSDIFNRVKLTFDSFDIEADPQCMRDRVIVYDGPTEQAPVLGTFCGYSLPNPLESSSAQLLVKFESDSSAQRTGFKASFDTEPLTPSLPNSRFLFNNPFANPWASAAAIGGRSMIASMPGMKPIPVDTSVPLLRNDQISPTGHYATKMSASFANRPSKCNGAVTLVKANEFPMYAQSPNFGNGMYYPQDTCYWLIQSDVGTVIRVNFISFDLEHGGRSCPNDFVALYDGEGDQAPLLGKFCGPNVPETVQSSGRALLVKFGSDQSNEKPGFKFAYEAVPNAAPLIIEQPPIEKAHHQQKPDVEEQPSNKPMETSWIKPEFFSNIANQAILPSVQVPNHEIQIPSVPQVPPMPQVVQIPISNQQSSKQQKQQPTIIQPQQQQTGRLQAMLAAPKPPSKSQMSEMVANMPNLPSLMAPSPPQRVSNNNHNNRPQSPPQSRPPVHAMYPKRPDYIQQFIQQQFSMTTSLPYVQQQQTGNKYLRPRNGNENSRYPPSPMFNLQQNLDNDNDNYDESYEKAIYAGTEEIIEHGDYDDSGSTFMSVPTGPQHEEVADRHRLLSQFTTACKGKTISLAAPSDGSVGQLTSSHDKQGQYLPNDHCNWFISAATGQKLQISFPQLELEASLNSNCTDDSLSLHDGVNRLSKTIGKFCSANPPPLTVTTSGPFAFLSFASSNRYNRGKGFVVEFRQISQAKKTTGNLSFFHT